MPHNSSKSDFDFITWCTVACIPLGILAGAVLGIRHGTGAALAGAVGGAFCGLALGPLAASVLQFILWLEFGHLVNNAESADVEDDDAEPTNTNNKYQP